ncbi:TPA: hypothetical protein ACYELM_004794, partial [Escherichia coli]
YFELHDEIADLNVMIAAIVDELAPELIKRNAVGSSRRRDHSRRPLTPPYMRLRIRRFMLTLELPLLFQQ